jgi:hypothetical protein
MVNNNNANASNKSILKYCKKAALGRKYPQDTTFSLLSIRSSRLVFLRYKGGLSFSMRFCYNWGGPDFLLLHDYDSFSSRTPLPTKLFYKSNFV